VVDEHPHAVQEIMSPAKGSGRSRLLAQGNLLTSLLLVFPLLLFYEVGVLFTDVMNGADFLTQTLLHFFGIKGFIGIQAGLVVCFSLLVFYLRRHQQFHMRVFIPILLESGIYALTMGTLIVFLMVDLLHINPQLAAGTPIARAGFFDRLILSVGAGVHEEIVFRLFLLGGISFLGEKVFNLRKFLAVLLALFLSSILFSAAHHLGPMGEPLRYGVFVYRVIAGMIFGTLFQFRGLAIAVYTHALYDIYVLIFL
jgi:hypothetical protein